MRRFLRNIGPALILATVVIGPGTLTLHTIAGSQYTYRLLWVPFVATCLMMLYTWISARIGLVTGMTILEAARSRYHPTVGKVGGISAYLATLCFQAGNHAAVGFAANALFGMSLRLWFVLMIVPAVLLILLPGLYGKLELLVKVFVGIMLVLFVGTLALVGIRPEALAFGLIPSFPDTDSVFLTLGMTATTFSIAAAVYQSYLMREKKWDAGDMKREGVDTLVGIAVLGTLSAIVLLTSAGAFYDNPQAVYTVSAMAQQLEPLAGPAAFYFFTLGFFFASFSSLIINPLIGATLLVDGFGGPSSMDSGPVKKWTLVAMGASLLVVLLFGESPVELLRVAQALAVVAFPVLGFLVLGLGRDKQLMGRHATKGLALVLAVAGYLAIIGIVLNYARQIVLSF